LLGLSTWHAELGIMVGCLRSTMISPRPLRRLRLAFGPIEVVEVISHGLIVSNDPEDGKEAGTGSLARGEDGGPKADDP
jgi:hypothetical protein